MHQRRKLLSSALSRAAGTWLRRRCRSLARLYSSRVLGSPMASQHRYALTSNVERVALASSPGNIHNSWTNHMSSPPEGAHLLQRWCVTAKPAVRIVQFCRFGNFRLCIYIYTENRFNWPTLTIRKQESLNVQTGSMPWKLVLAIQPV